VGADRPGPRIGFACLWAPDPITTWSHTPWHLRTAMRRHGDVVDAGVRLSRPAQTGLKGLHTRWKDGRPVTTWRQSRLTDEICRYQITRAADRAGCDAVLEIQDLAPLDLPYFTYQDMSFDAILQARADAGVPIYRGMSSDGLRRRQERQQTVYQQATGVIAMSHWLARNLVEVTGLPAAKVHVVHPGATVVDGGATLVNGAATEANGRAAVIDELPVRLGPRRRLLFVGREFLIKGGRQVLGALAILRREVDPAITLTVVGPTGWPLPGEVPDGVSFLGGRPFAEVLRLYDEHDLFVVPSRLEGFGIAFAEAISRGLPCVARDAYAMPEMVQPGLTGALVRGDDPAVLAEVIAKALADDALYAACRDRAPQVREHFTWDRAGREAVEVISRALAH
jgi:glycosyltransferase involved in cell wall biosynthesis